MVIKYLPIIGLCMEIVGLCFLFYDLLKSKQSENYEDSFQAVQNDIDSEVRKLAIRLNSALIAHSEFVAKYLSLEYGSLLHDLRSDNEDNESILERVRVKALSDFHEVHEKMLSESELKKSLSNIEAANMVATAHFIDQVKVNNKLRQISVLGVIFVGVGALTQLVPVAFSLIDV